MIKNFLLFGLIFFVVLGCGKDEPSLTAVKGRVIDNNTGQPISDATVSYSYSDHDEPNGNPVYTYESLKTDSKGEFICNFYGGFGNGPEVVKDGYLAKDIGKDIGFTDQYNYKYKLKHGASNDIGDQRLYPKDGVFSLVLINTAGNHKEVFGHFSSRIMDTQETPGRVIPLIEGGKSIQVSQGETVAQAYKVNAGDWVKIYWGYTYATRESNVDSFYVSKTDTAVYQINF